MSDSSSEEVVVNKPKAATPAKAVPKAAVDSDSDSDEVPKASPKAKALARPAVATDSEDESMPARPAPKVKAVAVDDSSSEEVPLPAKKAGKKTNVQASDSSEVSDVEKATKSKPKDGKAKQGADRGSENKDEEEAQDELRVYVAGLPFKLGEDDVKKDFGPLGEIKHAKILVDDKKRPRGIAFISFKTPEGVKAALKIDGNTEKYPGRTLKVSRANATTGKESKKKKQKEKQVAQQEKKKVDEQQQPELDKNCVYNKQIAERLEAAQKNNDFAAIEAIAMKLAKRARMRLDERNKKKSKGRDCQVYITGIPATGFDEDALRKKFLECGRIMSIWLPKTAEGDNRGYGTISFKDDASFQKALGYDGTKCQDSTFKVVKSRKPEGKTPEKGEDAKTPKKGKHAATPETNKKDRENGKKASAEATPKRKAEALNEEPPRTEKKKQVADEEALRKEKKQKLAEAEEEPPRKEKKKKVTEGAPAVDEEVVVKKKKKVAQ